MGTGYHSNLCADKNIDSHHVNSFYEYLHDSPPDAISNFLHHCPSDFDTKFVFHKCDTFDLGFELLHRADGSPYLYSRFLYNCDQHLCTFKLYHRDYIRWLLANHCVGNLVPDLLGSLTKSNFVRGLQHRQFGDGDNLCTECASDIGDMQARNELCGAFLKQLVVLLYLQIHFMSQFQRARGFWCTLKIHLSCRTARYFLNNRILRLQILRTFCALSFLL